MNKQKQIKVRFIGDDDPLALRHGHLYEAILGQKGMVCVVDETGEEYAYPPELFEVMESITTDAGVTTERSQLASQV